MNAVRLTRLNVALHTAPKRPKSGVSWCGFVAALFSIPPANGVAAPHNSNHNSGTENQAKFVTDARHL
jgi:hypothetical protein